MRASPALTDRHAVVTGGGSGIGAAIAAELAALGACVSLLGRSTERLEQHARRLRTELKATVFAAACDVTDAAAVERAFAAAHDAQGPADILVNNAGQAVSAAFLDTPRTLWDEMLTVNATGAYLCIQQVLPRMLSAQKGRIVNVASTAGLRGYAHVAAYCAAKHALVGLTRALAQETAKHGITVNAVCPGYTETEMADGAIANLMRGGRSREDAMRLLTRNTPRGKLTQPGEVASAVGWLCTPAAAAVTGHTLVVAGGEVV